MGPLQSQNWYIAFNHHRCLSISIHDSELTPSRRSVTARCSTKFLLILVPMVLVHKHELHSLLKYCDCQHACGALLLVPCHQVVHVCECLLAPAW
jgi:hypothetical protein